MHSLPRPIRSPLPRLVRRPLLSGAIGVLLLAATAPGASAHRDRNHDLIPDRWEARHGLSLSVDQARRDQDHDGVRNRGEFLARTDPRDADTDGDGVGDGEEGAGRITAFSAGRLTVKLFGGDVVTAHVDEKTRVSCRSANAFERESGRRRGRGHGARIALDDESGADDETPGDDASGDVEGADIEPSDAEAGDYVWGAGAARTSKRATPMRATMAGAPAAARTSKRATRRATTPRIATTPLTAAASASSPSGARSTRVSCA